MSLEAATYINQLISTNPVGGVDYVSQGDDHLRLLKAVLLNSFPNVNGACNPTPTEFNRLVGKTTPLLEQGDVDDVPVNGATTVPPSSNWAYDHQNATTGTHGVTGTILGTEDVDDTPVNGATTVPVSSNWAYDHNAATGGVHGITGTILGTEDIHQSPVAGATNKVISSAWADALVTEIDTGISADLAAHIVDTSTHGVTGAILGTEDVDNTPVNGATTAPISSDWAYKVQSETMTFGGSKTFSSLLNVADLASTNVMSQAGQNVLDVGDIDSTPVNGATNQVMSSDWGYKIESESMTFGGTKTFSGTVSCNGLLDINNAVREKVYNLTGTSINPANGTSQYKTCTGTTPFSYAIDDGESVLLRLINAHLYTVTWPTTLWTNGDVVPDLSSNCAVVIWRQGSTYFGTYVGSFA